MRRLVVTFPSTHDAIAAEDALRDLGLALQVIPLPDWIRAGCGLALRIGAGDGDRALEHLDRRGIRVGECRLEPEG